MELAMERNDADKIKDISRRFPPDLVRDFIERRILLTRAAQKGFAVSCRALLKHAGAAVDGVRSTDNKREWVNLQKESGDNNNAEGATPLAMAAENGHSAVVRVLLRHNANLTYSPKHNGGTPLHFAVAGGHQDIVERLVDAGANAHARDKGGSSPITLCETYLQWGQQGSDQCAKILEVLNGAERRQQCAACSAKDSQLCKCPCGLESYCDKACQRKRWRDHKWEHKEEMTLNDV